MNKELRRMVFDDVKDVAAQASKAYEDIQDAQINMTKAIKRLAKCESILDDAHREYGFETTISNDSEHERFIRNIQKYTVIDPQGDESDGSQETLSALP